MTSPSFETTLLKFNSPTAELRTSGRASSRAVLDGMKKKNKKNKEKNDKERKKRIKMKNMKKSESCSIRGDFIQKNRKFGREDSKRAE